MAEKTYLALGDSMSIDDYTGVRGGGAVNQFFRLLQQGWKLDDRTYDGCRISGVPTDGRGDLITLTVGGNDLLWNKQKYLSEGLGEFAAEHAALLNKIRDANPEAALLVGDIYGPAASLTEAEQQGLAEANAAVARNCRDAGAVLVPIHDEFAGHEREYLCLGIEPTLQGARAIAALFAAAFRGAGGVAEGGVDR